MEESLKTARGTWQALLGFCGVYLLGRLGFASTDEASRIVFLGVGFDNEAAFTLVIAVALLVTALRLCAYLEHIRGIHPSREDCQLLETFPWMPLLGQRSRMARAAFWFEIFVVAGVVGEICQVLRQLEIWAGITLLAAFLFLGGYAGFQLHRIGIRRDTRSFPDE
jgi:hypothetical protein